MERLAMKLDFDSFDEEENICCDSNMLDSSGDSMSIHINRNNTSSPVQLFSPRKCRSSDLGQSISSSSSSNIREHSHEFFLNSMGPGLTDESPPYKKIRALRLFDSPLTPKSILHNSGADAVPLDHSNSIARPSTRSRLFNNYQNKSSCRNRNISTIEEHPSDYEPSSTTSCDTIDQNTPSNSNNQSSVPKSANINPFTPSGMLLTSRKRTRSKRDVESLVNSVR